MNQQTESEVIHPQHKIGWIGAGRMGFAMARRLLDAGCDLAIYNRTRAKAEPLAEAGATVVDTPAELADRDIVFTMVSGPADLLEVVAGSAGLLSTAGTPQLVVDCSSVSEEGSMQVRSALNDRAKPSKCRLGQIDLSGIYIAERQPKAIGFLANSLQTFALDLAHCVDQVNAFGIE